MALTIDQEIDVHAALSVFADTMTALHIGPLLTCGEADNIAAGMCALGMHEEAAMFLDCHADGDDDPEDAHYKGGEDE